MKPFWIVYLEGRTTPMKKHWTYEDARSEAYRLNEKEKVSAYVLECVGGFEQFFVWKGVQHDV